MKLRGLIASHPGDALLAKAWTLALMLPVAAFVGLLPQGTALASAQDPAIERAANTSPTEADLRPGIKLPYIVKKGDTLWDIANYFFKNPHKWLKIWEQNLYITNPDLIYPGNEIDFARKAVKTGGLRVTRLQPEVHIKAAEHIEPAVDTSRIVTALQRQDFISPQTIATAGYVLDSLDERINYGANDRIYMKLATPAENGTVFDIFRSADPVIDPKTAKPVGMLVKHLGQVRVTGHSKGITEGLIIRAFEEISRGDRLKPARIINTRVEPDYPSKPLAGAVMYIRNNAAEAGQNQIIGIDLGAQDGVKTGSILDVLKAGRTVRDTVSGKMVALPEENIGQLIVLAPQPHASIALVTRSTSPINRGDAVRNSARP